MERQINDIFGYVGEFTVNFKQPIDKENITLSVVPILLKVVKSDKDCVSCEGCYFENYKDFCNKKINLLGHCSPFTRKDKVSVIFKEF